MPTLKNRLAWTAISASLILSAISSPANSARIKVDNVPSSMLGQYPDWKDVPDVSFDCEGKLELVLSHKDKLISLNGAIIGSIVRSNAMYQTAPDRFGNYVPVIAISIISGQNWSLSEIPVTYGWYFNRDGRIYKCLPR
jgi:hypothetical protein